MEKENSPDVDCMCSIWLMTLFIKCLQTAFITASPACQRVWRSCQRTAETIHKTKKGDAYSQFSHNITATMFSVLKAKKWQPCWCLDPILCELNFFIMQMFSFVFGEKHAAPNVSGFIAQLVRASHGYQRSRVQTPLKSWIFQASLRNCKNCIHNCKDHSFTLFHIRSSYMIHLIYHFIIDSFLMETLEPRNDQLPMSEWLHSSVG